MLEYVYYFISERGLAMTVLFYRYGSICEPSIINAFHSLNINVVEETCEMHNKNITPTQCVELMQHAIETTHPLFVFSINFFPAIAEICHIYNTLYLCWTVDSPVLELFSKSILHNTNRIFMFDKAQCNFFRSFNPNCIFHLPLASDSQHFDQVISTITNDDYQKYNNDISFVGSLYTEKNPMHSLSNLPDYVAGYINGITEAALKVYGYNFIEEILTDDIIQNIQSADSSFFSLADTIIDPARYITAHQYIGVQISETERIQTLNELAKYFDVTLYTRSDTSLLNNVHTRNGIKTINEMPKAFHLSKINLNITARPIQSGLPLRIFDILGCGGFVMTNYQEEINEHFEIGVDLETYTSIEELLDKCAYYLSHEEERKQIAYNGYQKAKKNHTYQTRIIEMLKIVTTNIN